MPAEITVTVAGSERSVPEQTTAADLFGDDRAVLVARVNGELRDLAHVLADGDVVEPVTAQEQDGLDVLRHSAAHVLAQAVQEVNPAARLGIGPPVRDGFYYDFGVDEPFTPEDLKALEKVMQRIVNEGQTFVRREVSDEDAARRAGRRALQGRADRPQGRRGRGRRRGGRGRGRRLAAHHLRQRPPRRDARLGRPVPRAARAHDQGARQRLQADAQRWRLLARERAQPAAAARSTAPRGRPRTTSRPTSTGSPRPSAATTASWGPSSTSSRSPTILGAGLPVFHPKGGVIKREMEDYVRRRHIEEGFDYVGSPHISREELFYTSGHLPYYADGMFPPMDLDGQNYRLKAMNCPIHNLIFRSRGRSYRELPLRFFEFGTVYRDEKSGVLQGLTRVRMITQDDSHSYVTKEGAAAEVRHLLDFVLSLLRDFGLDDYYLELSTRDDSKPDKFIGSEEQWSEATRILEEVAAETGLELVPDPGGAAFYGPKISVQARDAIGRTWQMSTIQYDFNQPARFELEYQAADGSRQQPVMIHSAKFGSIERFIGVLTEHYAGAFPPWLSPVQVTAIPVAEEFSAYLHGVADQLRRQGIRVEVDDSDDRFPKKIRNASKSKVPFVLIAGEDDRSAGAVSFRYRDGSQKNGVPVDEAVAEVLDAVTSRRQV